MGPSYLARRRKNVTSFLAEFRHAKQAKANIEEGRGASFLEVKQSIWCVNFQKAVV